MAMQTPSKGRIVIAQIDPNFNNGDDTCPAVVTQVWGQALGTVDGWTVNLRLIPDSSQAPIWKTSSTLFESEEEARGFGLSGCFWPPRV